MACDTTKTLMLVIHSYSRQSEVKGISITLDSSRDRSGETKTPKRTPTYGTQLPLF